MRNMNKWIRNNHRKYSYLLFSLLILFLSACDKGKAPYQEAEKAFAESNYSLAKIKVLEVVQNAPQSKYLSQAKAIYEKVDQIELLFKSAEDAEKAEDYKKAIEAYQEVAGIDAKSPLAVEGLKAALAKYRDTQVKTGEASIEKGEYEDGIEIYKELISVIPNDAEVLQTLKNAETTFSSLKKIGDDAIAEFRVYIKAKGTRNYEVAEFARVKYLRRVDALYKLAGGRIYLSARLKAYLAEVETALNDFLQKGKAVERAKSYEQRVLAADEYNRALSSFIERYGRPEAWIGDDVTRLLRKKIVDQWM